MRCAVLGGGTWGTALAAHLVRAGHPTRLWLREADICRSIEAHRVNPVYLPEVALPATLEATLELDRALAAAEAVFVVIPSEYCRGVYRALRGRLAPGTPVISATKGLEVETLRRMSEVASDELPGQPLAVVSGPSFALEVAREQPTAVVVASGVAGLAEPLQQALSTRSFRAYSSDDVVGVELAGALKNVIAIATGIVDGLGYGHNTVAALITRGLAEMTRLSVALGGRPETLAGLAGLGDLVLTCTDDHSRNRRFGLALARGLSVEAALADIGQVVEGYHAARALHGVATRERVTMPITEGIYGVLYQQMPAWQLVRGMMQRPIKPEFEP